MTARDGETEHELEVFEQGLGGTHVDARLMPAPRPSTGTSCKNSAHVLPPSGTRIQVAYRSVRILALKGEPGGGTGQVGGRLPTVIADG